MLFWKSGEILLLVLAKFFSPFFSPRHILTINKQTNNHRALTPVCAKRTDAPKLGFSFLRAKKTQQNCSKAIRIEHCVYADIPHHKCVER